MTTTYLLTSVQDAVEIGTTLTKSWFRGHSESVGKLTPRIFRPEFTADPLLTASLPLLERRFIEQFKRDARPLAHHQVPDDDDHLGWLYVMQHYEAPTRLLDWTENVLAALFFAVTSEREKDGELWALLPWALNNEADVGWGMPLYDRNPVLDYLVREPFWPPDDRGKLATEIAEKYDSEEKVFSRPVAFEPRRDFTRMVVQSSTFTIHPEPSKGNTIPEVLTDPRSLVRYVIPAGCKWRLTRELGALGVTDTALFPDFEGIAKGLTRGGIDVGYSPPDPPEADGPYDADKDS